MNLTLEDLESWNDGVGLFGVDEPEATIIVDVSAQATEMQPVTTEKPAVNPRRGFDVGLAVRTAEGAGGGGAPRRRSAAGHCRFEDGGQRLPPLGVEHGHADLSEIRRADDADRGPSRGGAGVPGETQAGVEGQIVPAMRGPRT